MRLKKCFQLALNIFIHSKLRSWLTIIGIVIGIAAVVSIVSISNGASQTLEERLSGLGADIITITPGVSRARGIGFGGGGGFNELGSGGISSSGKNLTSRDVLTLKAVPNVAQVMGQVSARSDVKYLGKSATINVVGVDIYAWKEITTEKLTEGRFLTQGDSFSVVLGSNVASNVFNKEIPINSKIIIEGKSFKIVGIVQDSSTIYMPISVARITLDNIGKDEFNSITVKVEDIALTDETVDSINNKLMLSRGILNEREKDFSVSSLAAIRETLQQTLSAVTLFLGAIAAISLIVGGVGIANTMFTSVLEKTKDIGIMKAIGAQNKDVLTIFLLNSGLIGLVGGIVGVLIGVIASSAINSAGGIGLAPTAVRGAGPAFGSSSLVTPQLVIGSLLFSTLIGMIAGAIPAYRASKLNPVDALRYE
ncbi:ABC transporter permease [Candidatus Woesearchaeota archaeon]|nr:ABC transporter permease [Candidatus Woesearchaeota archaeon]